MKVLCPSPDYFSDKIKKILSKKFVCNFSKMNNEKFNKICHNYEIILIRFNNIINYKSNTSIKFILSPTTGTEHISEDFYKNKNINILTLKKKFKFLTNVRATIEFTIFLILLYLRKKKNFEENQNRIKKNIFQNELYGKNIGIIGYGRIGKKVSKILSSFDANLRIFETDTGKKVGKKNFTNLSNILKNSDIILIHIPLNSKNKNFLDKNKLKMLKKGTAVINTSRGEIIDEEYMFNLVKNKKISYFTDVISNETQKNKKKIIKKLKESPNFFFSNHIAGLTKESVEKTDLFIYKNFQKKLNC